MGAKQEKEQTEEALICDSTDQLIVIISLC
jgi:hypothetical protein